VRRKATGRWAPAGPPSEARASPCGWAPLHTGRAASKERHPSEGDGAHTARIPQREHVGAPGLLLRGLHLDHHGARAPPGGMGAVCHTDSTRSGASRLPSSVSFASSTVHGAAPSGFVSSSHTATRLTARKLAAGKSGGFLTLEGPLGPRVGPSKSPRLLDAGVHPRSPATGRLRTNYVLCSRKRGLDDAHSSRRGCATPGCRARRARSCRGRRRPSASPQVARASR
jgi:hypothetical protein